MIGVKATGRAHLLGREVRVGARAIPVALDGLGVETDVDLELFGDALEQPPRRPELIPDGDRIQNAHLELPLAHHHFGVGTFDSDARAHAGDGVGFDDVAPGHFRPADAAVVRTLGTGKAVFGPAVGSALLEERVLLLDTEHRLEAGELLRHLDGAGAVVGGDEVSPSALRTSHITRTSFGPRSGSGQTKTGSEPQSERSPVAWFVLDPSKPHTGGFLPSATILVLLRKLAGGFGPVYPDVFSLIRQRCSLDE